MSEELWWKKPLRIFQTNLQAKDAPLMDPAKIAAETEALGANALVFNVGGIYAWYRSKVPFHHINEYLPADRDLLEQIITECHKRNIKFIARFDFSKVEDSVYQRHPEWFVQYADGTTRIYGKDRPGSWSLLVTTCLNAGYRNEEVAVPVLEEVLGKYEIDGVFFNAPHYEYCLCDICRRKYHERYGTELPEFKDYSAISWKIPEGLEDWQAQCIKDNMALMQRTVRRRAPHVPLIMYYTGQRCDHLADKAGTGDLIVAESQNVLSRGHARPPFWYPAISMKMGRSLEDYSMPIGMIHTCPGMDWRHTGIPTPEFEFWMSQIPANGGTLWQSATGVPDTIGDKRILKSVGKLNQMIAKVENIMHGAQSAAQLLLLWEGHPEGLAEGLFNTQLHFDIACGAQVTKNKLGRYNAVIVPDGFPMTSEISLLLKEYVSLGGKLLVESGRPDENLREVLGTGENMFRSSYLTASYLKFRDPLLKKGLEETEYVTHRGETWYCRPQEGTRTLATLVPPFAPLDAVGAPPERATILSPDTDIPLVLENTYGKGKAIYLPFRLGHLIEEYGLNDHNILLGNLISLLNPEPNFRMKGIAGLQASVWRNGNTTVVHLVNGVGQRPLKTNIPLQGLEFDIELPSEAKSVRPLIEDAEVTYSVSGRTLHVVLDKLTLWNAIQIDW